MRLLLLLVISRRRKLLAKDCRKRKRRRNAGIYPQLLDAAAEAAADFPHCSLSPFPRPYTSDAVVPRAQLSAPDASGDRSSKARNGSGSRICMGAQTRHFPSGRHDHALSRATVAPAAASGSSAAAQPGKPLRVGQSGALRTLPEKNVYCASTPAPSRTARIAASLPGGNVTCMLSAWRSALQQPLPLHPGKMFRITAPVSSSCGVRICRE